MTGLLEAGRLESARTKLPYSRLATAALSRCAVTPLLPSRNAFAIIAPEYSAKIGTKVSNNWRLRGGGVDRAIHSSWEITHPSRLVWYTSSAPFAASQLWIVS